MFKVRPKGTENKRKKNCKFTDKPIAEQNTQRLSSVYESTAMF